MKTRENIYNDLQEIIRNYFLENNVSFTDGTTVLLSLISGIFLSANFTIEEVKEVLKTILINYNTRVEKNRK